MFSRINSRSVAAMLSIAATLSIFGSPACLANAPVTVSCDASKIVTTTNLFTYGINGFRAMDANAITPSYLSGLNQLNTRFIRLHNGLMMTPSSAANQNGWYFGWLLNDPSTTPASQVTWDENKIHALLEKLPSNSQIMIDIVNWPSAWAIQAGVSYPIGPSNQLVSYPKGDPHVGRLNPRYYGAYASLCAKLVKIVQQTRHVHYWEILNEVDHLYWAWMSHTNVDLNSVSTIYNQTAIAMKAVDPTILTGGPAIQDPSDTAHQFGYYNNKVWNPGLLSMLLPNLDFYTFHLYDDEDVSFGANNQQLFQITRNNFSVAQSIVQGVKSVVASSKNPTKVIPVFWDEYNVNGNTYNPKQITAVVSRAVPGEPDPRINTNAGAVCDAIVNIEALRAGVAKTLAFCDGPAWYGHLLTASKSSAADTPVPSGYTLGLLNSFFAGNIFQTQSSDETQVLTLGCTGAGGTSILLVNQNSTPTNVTLKLQQSYSSSATVTEYIIDGTSYRRERTNLQPILTSGLTLTPESVTVIKLP